MRRNRAPAVTLTDDQRQLVDEAVLGIIRLRGPLRASEIVGSEPFELAIASLPSSKPDHRYLGEAFQRLKAAGKIELVRARWKTTSPTA